MNVLIILSGTYIMKVILVNNCGLAITLRLYVQKGEHYWHQGVCSRIFLVSAWLRVLAIFLLFFDWLSIMANLIEWSIYFEEHRAILLHLSAVYSLGSICTIRCMVWLHLQLIYIAQISSIERPDLHSRLIDQFRL